MKNFDLIFATNPNPHYSGRWGLYSRHITIAWSGTRAVIGGVNDRLNGDLTVRSRRALRALAVYIRTAGSQSSLYGPTHIVSDHKSNSINAFTWSEWELQLAISPRSLQPTLSSVVHRSHELLI